MKRLALLLSLAALISGGLTWFAQAQAPAQPAATPAPASDRVKDEETKNGWWDCTLPGGNYTIALGKITSVPKGALRLGRRGRVVMEVVVPHAGIDGCPADAPSVLQVGRELDLLCFDFCHGTIERLYLHRTTGVVNQPIVAADIVRVILRRAVVY